MLARRNTGLLSPAKALRSKVPVYPPRKSTKAKVITAGDITIHAKGMSTKADMFTVTMLRGSLAGPCRRVSLMAAPTKSLMTVIRYGGYASSLGT